MPSFKVWIRAPLACYGNGSGHALALYRERKVTLAKAAELADISVREMMDLIKEKGLSLYITSAELREDFEAALRRRIPARA
jgi:predicted HTH domain antitoxin